MIKHFFFKGGFVALAFLLLAALWAWLALNERATARAMADHGIAGIATVEALNVETERRRDSDGRTRSDTDYNVTYSFEAVPVEGGAPVTQQIEREVSQSTYDETVVGQQVEIRYLPENPTRVEFSPGEFERGARLWDWAALGTLAVAVGFAAMAVRLGLRAYRLDITGMKAEATVEEVRRVKGGATISLRYTDAEGTLLQAKTTVAQRSPWAATEAGGSVFLRYDPKDPSNIALV